MTTIHRSLRPSFAALALAAGLAATGLAAIGPAHAGSVSSSDTWAADYEGLALPAGTLLVFDYVGYQTNNNFVDTHGNTLGGKADLFTDLARVSYWTKFAGMPLVLEATLPYAEFNGNPTIAGQVESAKGGFFSPVLYATLGLIVDPKKQTYLGLTNYFYLPSGGYDASKQINIATDDQFVWVPQIGWSQGLGNKFAVDVIANASFHTDGKNPLLILNAPVAPGVTAPLLYDHVTQDVSYDIKGFLRYDYMQLGHLSVGLEKSFGGLQQYAGGSIYGMPVPVSALQISKDDYLRGHLQATAPLAADFQVGVDLTHDFEHTGGYREDFGAEVRFTKIFLPTAPAAAAAPTK